MCTKTLFHPTGPCCGSVTFCKAWPTVDWRRMRWLVITPDAELLQKETVYVRRAGMYDANTWNHDEGQLTGPGAHPDESFVGSDIYIPGPDALFGTGAAWFRGGRYLATHNGSCVWQVRNRETLIHRQIALIGCTKTFPYDLPGYSPPNQATWNLSAASMLTAEQLDYWETKFTREPEIQQVVNGVPFFGPSGAIAANEIYVSIRDVFPRLACYWLPLLESRSDISDIGERGAHNGIAYDPLTVIRTLQNPNHVWTDETLYMPTALDIAAACALGPGFLFGFVTDKRSPLFGQFTCFEGGVREDGGQGIDGAADPVLQSVPWQLVSGDSVRAEHGVVNRFERTTDDDSLPAWLTLQVVIV